MGLGEVLPADLADDEGCALVEKRCAEGIDLLVNNAGSGGGAFDSVAIDEEQLPRVNVRAVLRLTHAVCRRWWRAAGGIVNVSSVAGFAPGAPGRPTAPPRPG